MNKIGIVSIKLLVCIQNIGGHMELNIVKSIEKNYDSILVFLYEGEKEIGFFQKNLEKVNSFLESKKFKGKNAEKLTLTIEEDSKFIDISFIGLGEREKADNFEMRRTVYGALQGLKSKELLIVSENNHDSYAFVETIILSDYKFDKYKSKDKEAEEKSEKNIDVLINLSEEKLVEAKILAESIKITRDLVNEPSNVIYPETLALEAKKCGEEFGFEVEIFDEDKIKELGMEAFLAVARAAHDRPKFIVMRYFGGAKNDEVIGLVGKGLTYDTGGLSLKPSNSMDTMKSDMGGAATVIGAMAAIARQKLNKNVISVIAACENSIGGNAYRPGDIIGSMAGKKIEILNTDAEGRLTLIDAVHYIINNEKVNNVIDIATLTGAALVALGTTTTAALSNNDELYQKMDKAAKDSDERLWRLPNYPEYGKLIESKIADYKNIGGRWAGTITAGMFIEKFVGETPWIHLDIAGTSWADAPYDYYTLGGTGQMVRTLYNFVKKY